MTGRAQAEVELALNKADLKTREMKKEDIRPEYEYADAVDHPSHYGGDAVYECMKVIEAWGLNAHFAFAVKHICRAGKKDGEAAEKDIEKAVWYLRRWLKIWNASDGTQRA